MAGGKGTRLQNVNSDIPKPMFAIDGKPILEYQIESLKKSGINDIILIIGHLGSAIRKYFGDGSRFGVKISYINEDKPLGTAGSFYYLKNKVENDFLLLFGDLMLDIDWRRFVQFHKEHNAWITLFGHPNSHPFDSDVILTDEESRVVGIDSKNNIRNYCYHNFVNAGLYVINERIAGLVTEPVKMDLEKELINSQTSLGHVYAYRSSEYVKDIGTPDRLKVVTDDVISGIVGARSLQNAQKAIFLDRDGAISKLRESNSSPDQFELMHDAAEAIRRINGSSYLAIVTTNQPIIIGENSMPNDLKTMHIKLETELGKNGAYLDDFFYPHDLTKGYVDDAQKLKIECRKSKIGMFAKTAEKYNIDLTKSWYIADSMEDVQTAVNAQLNIILLKTDSAGEDIKHNAEPTFIAKNLMEAIQFVMNSRM